MRRNLLFLFLAGVLVSCRNAPDKSFFDRYDITPINLSVEVAQAKAGNKLLLLEFGSSDSCEPCIRFEKQVFTQPEFMKYADANLVFVRVDFPFNSDLSKSVNATNNLLSNTYQVEGFPSFIALDKGGKEFWRMPKKGDQDPPYEKLMEPQAFISLLDSVKNSPR
ncbi:MAG TPA: thioredoxin family protein [Verrucomicrobiae bacterium]|nr:thioredoxin family protein [Verrucomicrobiae bacterium]